MKKLCILAASLLAAASTWAAYIDVGLTNADFDACTQEYYPKGFDYTATYDIPGWKNYPAGDLADAGVENVAWWVPYQGYSAFMKTGDGAYLLSPYVIQSSDQFNIGFMAKAWSTDVGAWTVTLFYGTDPSTNAIAVYNTGTLPKGNSVATWAPFGTNNIAATPASVGQTLGILFQSTGGGFANLDEVTVQRYVALPLDFGNTYPVNGATGVTNDVVLSCDVINGASTFSSANLYLNSFANAPVPASVVSGGGTNTVTADVGLALAPNSTNTAYVIANSPSGAQTNSWTFTMTGQYDITLSPAAGGYALAYDYQPTISAQIVDVNDDLNYVELYTNGVYTATGIGDSSTTTVSVVSGKLDPGVVVTNMIIAYSATGYPDVTNQWSFTMGGATGITVWNSSTPPVGAFDVSQTNAPTADAENISIDDVWTYVAGNQPAQGQFFTTPAGTYGYQLTSVWLRHTPYEAGSTGFGVGATATLRITDPAYTNSASFVKASEALSVINDGLVTADGRWIQFKLANPVLLSSDKTYGFDLEKPGGHFDTCGLSSDAYAGGSAYSSGANGVGGNTAALPPSGDRTFIVSLAESGAPFNVDSFTPSGSGATNLVTLQVNFTQLGGTYDEANTKLYIDGVELSFSTAGSAPNYSISSTEDLYDPLTTHTGMVVLASSSPVSTTTNYTYFTLTDALSFTEQQPALNANLPTNETPLSVKIIPGADSVLDAAMYLDGVDTGAVPSSSGGTNTLSIASSGILAPGQHSVMVVAKGSWHGDVTNSWNFIVQTTTDNAVWNINFAGRTGVSATVADGTVLAAPSAGSNAWNNLIAPAVSWNPSNAVTIVQANGSRTIGLDWVDDGGNNYQDWSADARNGVTDNLFESWYGKGSFNGTMQISGLDANASYDIYVYSTWPWNEKLATFNVTQGYADTTTLSFTPVRANAGSDYADIAEGENYVIFTKVTPSLDGEIDINLQSSDGGWSGMQILENPGQASYPDVTMISKSPANGSIITNNSVDLEVVMADFTTTVDPNNVVLLLDGSSVTPESMSKLGTTTTVTYATGVINAGPHTAGIIPAPGARTNEWTFVLSYEQSIPTALIHDWNFMDGSGTTVTDVAGGANGTIMGTNYAWVAGGGLYLAGGGRSGDWNSTTSSSAGSYVDLPNHIMSGISNSVTIEATYRADDSSPTWQRIYTFGVSGGGENISDGAVNALFLTVQASTSVPRVDYLNGPEFQLNASAQHIGTITHVVWVYDPASYMTKMYQNGVLVDQKVGTAAFNASLSTLNDVNNWIGRSQWNDAMFHGNLYDLRIYTGLMTASEVTTRYAAVTSNVGPETGPVVSVSIPTGGPITIVWPDDGYSYSVMTNADLTNPAGWGEIATTPYADGGNSVVTNAIGSEEKLFYKLQYNP